MPLFTSPVFDLTLTTIFAPICFGGQIRIEGGNRRHLPSQDAPSAVKLTPSHIALLAALPSITPPWRRPSWAARR